MQTVLRSFAVLMLTQVILAACSSSGPPVDVRVVDVRALDVASADRSRVDAQRADSTCAPNSVCPEACLDAKATVPPIIAWTATWNTWSNASFLTQLTVDPRRCKWQSLNDSCTMFDCLKSEWSGSAATMKGVSAGKFTIANGSGGSVTLSPDANSVYPGQNWPTIAWHAGDKITYTAEGATIPAFAVSIDFPTLIQASDPLARDAGTGTVVDPSVPVTFSWTPTDEKVLIGFGQQPATELWDRQELWCIFDGAAGTGTMPATVLQHLKLGSVDYFIGHYNRRCYTVGGFHVQATATHGKTWPATVK